MTDKKYLIPKTSAEAVKLFTQHENSKYIAGGTDLIVNFKQNNIAFQSLIDVSSLPELKTITANEKELTIGASCTLQEIAGHDFIKKNLSILKEAALSIASPITRASATIGGNLLCENRCVFYNQSDWWRESIGNCLKCEGDICIATGGKKNCFSKSSSDMAPALLACNAEVSIQTEKGTKRISAEQLYSGEGVYPHTLKAGELIVAIHIPIVAQQFFYFKLRQRQSIDFSSLTIAMSYQKDKSLLKIGIGSADPKPVYWEYKINGETKFEDDVLQKVKKIRFVENDYYSRDYRKDILLLQLNKQYQKFLNTK